MDKTTIKCAELCQASYDDSDKRFTDVGPMRYGVISDGDITYVVFRGTYNRDGWLLDLKVVPNTTRKGTWAEAGFIEAADIVWDSLLMEYAPGPNTIFVGHSLGGAMALIYAEEFDCQVVTFGCPRVWWRFANTPRINHCRVMCDDDPVPQVPNMMLWKHDREPDVFLKSNAVFVHPDDHSIDVYIERLRRI